MNKKQAGYQYLLAYKITVPIYDYTVEFTGRWVNNYSRTVDQMVQAARSGMQNIAEGSKQQSLSSYIKLAGVARGSLEELLNDYYAFARQNNIAIWEKERIRREIRERGEIWKILARSGTLPSSPSFPTLPTSKEQAINLLVDLIKIANYLIDRLVESLKEKHRTEGGFSEKLYRNRKQYRGY